MRDVKKPIGVAEWQTRLVESLPKNLRGSLPTIAGTVTPTAMMLRLPETRQSAPPRVGNPWELVSASVPADVVLWFVAAGSASIALPPFGVLELDPAAGLTLLAQASVPASGVDPLARAVLALPQDPALAGARIYLQAINAVTSARVPQLTNSFATVIQP